MTTRGRRLNGEGSIYQRKDGRWTTAIRQGAGRRQVYCDTEKEAVAALLKLRTEIAAGTLPKANRLTSRSSSPSGSLTPSGFAPGSARTSLTAAWCGCM